MCNKKKLPENLVKRQLERLKAYIGHTYSNMNLVGQYENAIDILINNIIDEKERVDLIAHPLLYLMRHSIELALKDNIKFLNKYSNLGLGEIKKTHSIKFLFEEFERHYYEIANNLNFETKLETKYNQFTIELKKLIQSLGNDWSSFRYVNSTSEKKIFSHTEILNIYDLKTQFDSSIFFLSRIIDVISPFTNYADFLKLDSSIKTNAIGFIKFRYPTYKKEWLIEKLNENHKKIKNNEIWLDEENIVHLHLKIANKECFVIPMRI